MTRSFVLWKYSSDDSTQRVHGITWPAPVRIRKHRAQTWSRPVHVQFATLRDINSLTTNNGLPNVACSSQDNNVIWGKCTILTLGEKSKDHSEFLPVSSCNCHLNSRGNRSLWNWCNNIHENMWSYYLLLVVSGGAMVEPKRRKIRAQIDRILRNVFLHRLKKRQIVQWPCSKLIYLYFLRCWWQCNEGFLAGSRLPVCTTGSDDTRSAKIKCQTHGFNRAGRRILGERVINLEYANSGAATAYGRRIRRMGQNKNDFVLPYVRVENKISSATLSINQLYPTLISYIGLLLLQTVTNNH